MALARAPRGVFAKSHAFLLCLQEHKRKNWLFSVSESGAKANAICLSLAETAKSNGVDFYEYLKKLLTDLPNFGIHQNPEILDQYLPWSKQAECSKKNEICRIY
jgi:hypothetical protein